MNGCNARSSRRWIAWRPTASCERCGGRQRGSLAGRNRAPEICRRPRPSARTRRHVLRQLDELLRQQDSLADPDDRERHHAMRIAAKRLRYTLEISRPVYPGRLDEAVEAIKRVQTLLGDIHDCDVWLDHLDAFAAEPSASGSWPCSATPAGSCDCSPGSTICRATGAAIGRTRSSNCAAYWADLNRRRFWDDLRAVACKPAANRRGGRRAHNARRITADGRELGRVERVDGVEHAAVDRQILQ